MSGRFLSPALELTPSGLYCPPADFYIDPWQPVDRAVITHGHSDHARWGCKNYLATTNSIHILKQRLGEDISLQTLDYDEIIRINGVTVSLHPAGHILGSAQVRLEYQGHVTVVSGDYKNESDPTCSPFTPVACHTFISECTFGLPVFRWMPQGQVFQAINEWWQKNAAAGNCSVIYAYALGKAQRVLAGIDPSIGPVFVHGAVENINRCYSQTGISLPQARYAGATKGGENFKGALVVAPPSADDPAWLRRFGTVSRAFASGWMRIRGNRRRRGLERGFVLSDHVDWQGILDSIEATGAEKIYLTHGYSLAVKRYLEERGKNADILETRFEGAQEE